MLAALITLTWPREMFLVEGDHGSVTSGDDLDLDGRSSLPARLFPSDPDV